MIENLKELLRIVGRSPTVVELISRLKNSPKQVTIQILEAAKPAVVASIAQELERPILLVTAHAERARELAGQLSCWLGKEKVNLLQQRELLFYQRAVTDRHQEQERVRTLENFSSTREDSVPLLVTSVASLMEKTVDYKVFRRTRIHLTTGGECELLRLVSNLQTLGYGLENTVEMPGEISRRGGILDIWSIAEETPFRLEFLGNNIESIRCFDPVTQRSLQTIEGFYVGLAGELSLSPLDDQEIEKILSVFNGYKPCGEFGQQLAIELESLRQGQQPDNAQFYTPLFSDGNLLDYMPNNGLLILDDITALEEQHSFISEEAATLREDKLRREELPPTYPIPYFDWQQIMKTFSTQHRLEFVSWGVEKEQVYQLAFRATPSYNGRLPILLNEVKELVKRRHRFVFSSCQVDRLKELLGEINLFTSPSLMLIRNSLNQGWILDNDVHLLTDNELFGFIKQARAELKRTTPRRNLLGEIKSGDYVVHVDHGIARYAGITIMSKNSVEKEYLVLEYAAADKLYVPVDQIDRVSHYIGARENSPVLSRLGTTEWQRTRRRTEKAVEEVAAELLELYASRQLARGYAFASDTIWQQELEGSFPYVETPDQQAALISVKEDMEKAKPMDRLIMGDVGYGKTEVALRAAFKAVMDGKQVAILVPTTILAQQHFTTFIQRLAAFPIKVDMLSRFRTPGEQKVILEGLRNGAVDVVIGTHRLLQKDVSFKALGLLVIDEEQRFGVNHKEYIKKMRGEVDVLALSATPIPRTLYMSLSGLRDISMMETPPERRLPVRTYVTAYDEGIIREAILRELERDGQVFFVHNRVQSIDMAAHRLAEIVPEASIRIAHGQMEEAELAQAMAQFTAGEVDILVCSTIIESGVDVPNTNTMIINEAEMLGLTQLYQLRGRVGRGANLSYAYLFYKKDKRMTPVAQQRLQAIYEAAELGAGYTIAVRDLEIRGAGNLLGMKQSGYISAVGLNLYTQLLGYAVAKKKVLQDGKAPAEFKPYYPIQPGIHLPLKAYLPANYVSDENLRLKFYKELALLDKQEELADKVEEFKERFGLPPVEANNLFYVVKIKLLARKAGVKSIVNETGVLTLQMMEGLSFNQKLPVVYRNSGVSMGRTQLKLNLKKLNTDWKRILQEILEDCI